MNPNYIAKQINFIERHIDKPTHVEDALWRIASDADLFSPFDEDGLQTELTDEQRNIVQQFISQFKVGHL